VSDESSDQPGAETPAGSRRRWLVGGIALLLLGAGVGVWIRSGTSSAEKVAARQAEVEARGAAVMPFDQNLTMHQFTKTDSGGVETVTANNPGDTAQIKLIQGHLMHEQVLFSEGNFTDPMAIHGMQMPGITDLQRGAQAGLLRVEYVALADGARLDYITSDASLISAMHTWFDAQLMDHGAHATG
jgi:hypothetical protein